MFHSDGAQYQTGINLAISSLRCTCGRYQVSGCIPVCNSIGPICPACSWAMDFNPCVIGYATYSWTQFPPPIPVEGEAKRRGTLRCFSARAGEDLGCTGSPSTRLGKDPAKKERERTGKHPQALNSTSNIQQLGVSGKKTGVSKVAL